MKKEIRVSNDNGNTINHLRSDQDKEFYKLYAIDQAVLNRDMVMERFKKEYLNHTRNGDNITLALFEMNDYKKVHDALNPSYSDTVLAELSQILMSSVRKSDILGWYSHEAFCLVLSRLDADSVLKLCDRIRNRVEKHPFIINGNQLDVTISVGLCIKTSFEETGTGDMIQKAEKALRRARENGRNRVEMER